jgi:hypothetical protein
MRALIYKAAGAYRSAWGFCPGCNSDAPGKDKCRICEGNRDEFPPSKETKRLRWARFTAAVTLALAGAACQTVPVDRPCGVIADSLRDVRGATPADVRRIDVHFERGVAAKCWGRGS